MHLSLSLSLSFTPQQFPLKIDMQHLFTVEALLEHPKTKDHLPISEGEVLFVLLLAHDKLPDGKYLAEKEDGTSEL